MDLLAAVLGGVEGLLDPSGQQELDRAIRGAFRRRYPGCLPPKHGILMERHFCKNSGARCACGRRACNRSKCCELIKSMQGIRQWLVLQH